MTSFADTMRTTVGFVPIAFLVALAIAILCEVGLRRTRLGLGLRAVGSERTSAHRSACASRGR